MECKNTQRYLEHDGWYKSCLSLCLEGSLQSQVVNNIFAYETNGLGSRYVMDDANVPVSGHVVYQIQSH